MEPVVLPLVNGGRPSPVTLALPSRGKEAAGPSLEKTAKDFESVFLGQMLDEMKKTVGQSGLLEDSASSQVLDVAWSGLARDVAGKGGLGLWKEIARQVGRGQAALDGESGPSPVPAAGSGYGPDLSGKVDLAR